MYAEERGGLLIITDEKPKPNVREEITYDGTAPLCDVKSREFFLKHLTPEQKDELLAFLPTMFLRCGGGGILGNSGMTDLVCNLRARSTFLSGVHFEEFT